MLGTAPMVIMAPAPNVEQRDYHETWHGKNNSRRCLKIRQCSQAKPTQNLKLRGKTPETAKADGINKG
jgi:hypothetical protein